MDMSKLKNNKIPVILLLLLGIVGTILGIMGLRNGGMSPYEARKGVVYLESYSTKGTENISASGTGWAIGKPGEPVQYVVTNGHVVEPSQTAGNTNPFNRIYFSAAENDFVTAQVVYYSPFSQKDLAILKLPSPTTKRIPLRLRDSDSVKIGDAAFALGYPSVSSRGQSFNTFDEDDITMTQGIISKRISMTGATYEGFQMDVSVNQGNSGGPTVDSKGNVVGINVRISAANLGDQNQTVIPLGLTYSIIGNELMKILDAERIEYTMASTGLSWMQGWVSYVFLGLGLLAIGAGIFLMYQSQRSSTAVMSGSGSSSGQAVSSRGPVKKKAVLRGVTGKYSGQSFDLEKGKVVIGRDPATANLIFDESTAGISRRHCQISYDPTEDIFLITDLGSSYGTFLGNGKKLAANVPERLSAEILST